MIADPVFADMLSATPDEVQSRHSHTQDHAHSHGASSSKAGRNERDSAQEKVRSTLRSFVRDWSEEGSLEREACYTPCLEALERQWPNREGRGGKKVLIPGCGLGRLAMEIAAKGVPLLWLLRLKRVDILTPNARLRSSGKRVQRLHARCIQLCAESVRPFHNPLHDHTPLMWYDRTTKPNYHYLHPFLHSFSNHLTTQHLLKRIHVPDICPADVLGDGSGGEFSMVAGDFEEIYSDEAQHGQWSSVVTCFFVDTVIPRLDPLCLYLLLC